MAVPGVPGVDPGAAAHPGSVKGDVGMREMRGINPRADDQLSELIIACVIRVHQTLGPGFLESVYRRALLVELAKRGLLTEVEKEVIIYYDGVIVGRHRLDLVVEARVILELKAIESLSKAHYAQVRSYLKAARLRLALLINFAGHKADFGRIDNPYPPIPLIPRSPL
jgi:GxxExxY protein